jgi:hypothetical protein
MLPVPGLVVPRHARIRITNGTLALPPDSLLKVQAGGRLELRALHVCGQGFWAGLVQAAGVGAGLFMEDCTVTVLERPVSRITTDDGKDVEPALSSHAVHVFNGAKAVLKVS